MGPQKGFSTVFILVILTVMAIVAASGIGYFRVQTQQTKTEISQTPTLKFDKSAVYIDPFGDRGGPYFHQIFMARSSDGLNFTKEGGVLFDKASVPDIIRLPDGKIFIYAVDGAKRSNSGFMVAISKDNGKTFEQGSMQLKSSLGLVSGADPEVVLLEDGKLRLYYIGFGGKPQPGIIDTQTKNWVQSAVSTDGINFKEEEGKRFEYAQITDPDVVKIGNKYFMYLAQGPRLILASSDDGLNYKYEKIVREKGSVSNTVQVTDGLWRQFYCDRGIRSATTKDGLNFEEDNGTRLQPDAGKAICDPAPVQIGSEWLMVYKVAEGKQPP